MRTPLLALVAIPLALAGCMSHEVSSEPVATTRIEIPGPWVFEPRVAEVVAGTTVTFVNNGGAAHTVTFEELPFDEVIEAGAETTFTFEKPGTYEYTCKFHPPGMSGTVIVREKPASAANDTAEDA